MSNRSVISEFFVSAHTVHIDTSKALTTGRADRMFQFFMDADDDEDDETEDTVFEDDDMDDDLDEDDLESDLDEDEEEDEEELDV